MNKCYKRLSLQAAGIGLGIFMIVKGIDINEGTSGRTEAIYSLVPEIKRVEYLEKRLSEFDLCQDLTDASERLSHEQAKYKIEYAELIAQPEVIEGRLQIKKNKRKDKYSSLFLMGGLELAVISLVIPYAMKKG